MREFHYQKNVGDDDFKWAKEYGLTFRISGALYVRIHPTLPPYFPFPLSLMLILFVCG